MTTSQWPAPDPVRGAALDKTGVADLLGWHGRSSVDVATYRTRQATAAVAFPAPDGHAVRTGPHWPTPTPSRHMVPYWWTADIISYRNERRAAGSGAGPTT